MKAILLGTAAGGGFPQWNCTCPLCTRSRKGDPAVPARTQDGLAISRDGERWLLVNASPDLRTQLNRTPALAPGPGRRETPIEGVLLTDAELDHTMGLLTLREQAGLKVWAPATVMAAMSDDFPVQHVTAQYNAWEWRELESNICGFTVETFGLGRKRPRYAVGSFAEGDWVVAYRFVDAESGGVLVYAPCLSAWPPGFDSWLDSAGCVIIDGTFFSPDEMTDSGVDSTKQAAMGHLPIDGPDGSLVRARAHRGSHWIYTHLNNTNPVLDKTSAAYRRVRHSGAEVPVDGTVLEW